MLSCEFSKKIRLIREILSLIKVFTIHRSTFRPSDHKGEQGIAVLNDKTRNHGGDRINGNKEGEVEG